MISFRKTMLVVLAAALILAPTAAAHKTTYSADGKVKIVWGFLNEPAVTMTKNGLDLVLSDNATGAPITNAQALHAELTYGGAHEELLMTLSNQFGKPGGYTALVTPSKPGLYTLHLKGDINGSEVDMEIAAAHDVRSIEETYFPELEHEDGEKDGTAALLAQVEALESRIAALEAKAQTQSQTPASVTQQPTASASDVPGFGALLAALAVALAVALRRRG